MQDKEGEQHLYGAEIVHQWTQERRQNIQAQMEVGGSVWKFVNTFSECFTFLVKQEAKTSVEREDGEGSTRGLRRGGMK